ncbi:hypothetical protein L873DRAFT_1799146 [Choiromyces venosus 120613-1]|uniref:Uncharacterized protein n=1 Tax=Choiromyces venosus 120613-1 TaxID=1336337 RepID=A0A3N4K5A4_9PEZI|nr:hypothetical protein L873DRAFT_1799146 [Choiromyces venosus 120613-1]
MEPILKRREHTNSGACFGFLAPYVQYASSNSRTLHKQALTIQPLHIFSFRLQPMQCAGGYGKRFCQLKHRDALDT